MVSICRIAAGLCLLLSCCTGIAVAAETNTSFVKISNSGSPIDSNSPLGSADNQWACTLDSSTGLMWEVKASDGGVRDRNWTYTPYDGNPKTNGGWAGYRDDHSGKCLRSEMDEQSCNTEAFVIAINRMRLCGFDDWRLPTVSELINVAAETSEELPSDTSKHLPNTAEGWYWTGVQRVGVTAFSRVVLLPNRGRPHFYDGSYMVLVVRDNSSHEDETKK